MRLQLVVGDREVVLEKGGRFRIEAGERILVPAVSGLLAIGHARQSFRLSAEDARSARAILLKGQAGYASEEE